MRALVISGYGVRLRYRNGAFIVETKEGKEAYTPSDIESILILTSGVTVSARAVRAASDYGIDIVFLNPRGDPAAVITHPYATRTVDTRRAQYAAYERPLGAEAAATIVYSKIRNQAALLRAAARQWGIPEIREEARALEETARKALRVAAASAPDAREELMAIEASAARRYWGAYAAALPEDTGFDARDRDGGDPVNTALNYGYGILYRECFRSAYLAGLDPYAGFLHTDRSGKPVLTFDLVEPFRAPTIDWATLKMAREGRLPTPEKGLLPAEGRRELAAAFLRRLGAKVRGPEGVAELRSWIRWFGRALARSLREGARPPAIVLRW